MGPELVQTNDFKYEISDNQIVIFWPKKLLSNPQLKILTKDGSPLFTGTAVNKLLLGDNLKKLDQKIIQFCFIDQLSSNSTHQFCSGYYKVDHNQLKKNKRSKPAFVEINKNKVENIGKTELQIGQKIEIKVQFEDGSIYQ